MAPRRCCCPSLPCEIGADDFNRSDSNDPGLKWEIISGEWEIVSNTLRGDGQLATRICHPPAYTIGSYVAEMLLVGMSDGTTSFWEVWIGDPSAPAYKVEVTHNSMTSQATLSLYNTTGLVHAETYSGVTTNETLKICWAPEMMVSVFLGNRIPHIDDCTAAAGSPCYTVGMVDVGGFSFVEGRFDDWVYNVHFIENVNCEACSCFCYRTYLDEEGRLVKDYSCLPGTLTLTFESVGADAATFPDITLTQSFGSPATPWPNKEEGWNSQVFSCGLPVFEEFTFRFFCGRPVNVMRLAPLSKDYDINPGQFVWRWVSGANPTNSFRNAIIESSTCEPLSIVFPEIAITSAFPSPICDIGLFPFGAHTPYCGSRKDECFANAPDIRFIPRIVV